MLTSFESNSHICNAPSKKALPFPSLHRWRIPQAAPPRTKEHQERFFAGVPNILKKAKEKMAIYQLFLQHIIYSLKPGGKAAVKELEIDLLHVTSAGC
jgi:hypothetical protein